MMAQPPAAAAQPSVAAPPAPPQAHFNAKPPEPIKLGSDAAANWKLWKQLWSSYGFVADIDDASRTDDFRKALFISTMGIEGLQIYNACDPDDTDTIAIIIGKMDGHILGHTNETFERYKFNTRAQHLDETTDTYVAALKNLWKTCNFCDCLQDSLLRDRIVFGVKDGNTRKRLLQERNLDLRKCIDICRTYENTASQLKVISGNAEDVHRVERTPVRPMRHGAAPRNARKTFRPRIDCKFCGRNHERKKESCPAWWQVYKKCRGKNHFATCCPPDVRRKTHGVTGEYPQSSHADGYEDDCILSVETDAMHSVSTHPTGPLYPEMRLPGGKPLRMQIDSGATVNVMPAKHVGSAKLMHSDVQLRMYNNKATVKPLGKCRLYLVNPVNNHRYQVEFQVIEENLTPLLSRKAAERMNLITVNYANFKQLHVVGRANCEAITDEFKTVFEGASIGCLPGTVSLKTEDGARPVQCPPQRVPIALQTKLKEELDDLVKSKVITPVTEPTEWCSQNSIQTKKNGNLRICIDPRPLNEALRRERYPLPTIEDILPELSHAKVFSKVDLSHGYWHCKLDEASSYLTTFITPHGRYRWLRLPFGTKVSSEIFQRKLNDNLVGLKGIVCVADDILIYGGSEEQHDSNLRNLLARCRENGLKLNKEKSMFHCSTPHNWTS